MLVLPIKKKWFDLILSGVQREEYREIKPYWTSRFRTAFEGDSRVPTWMLFRCGYRCDSPCLRVFVSLCTGFGRPEWGAKADTRYYVLTIHGVELLK